MGQSQARCVSPTLPADAPTLRIRAHGGKAEARLGPPKPLLILGSRRDCHLSISHGDVAKTHAAIVHTGPAILVVDLCSRSGTWLDDERVRRGVLTPGARLRLGPVELRLEFDAPPDVCDPAEALRLNPPLHLELGGQMLELGSQPIVIGRRSVCDVVIDTPDTSLAHALIFQIAGQPVVADLASRSGTMLEGQPIDLAVLHDGAALTIGGETLRVHCESSGHPPCPVPAAEPEPPATRPAAADEPVGADADIERLLAGLEQRIVALRTQMRVELDTLRRRQQELDAREQQLESRVAGLDARESALHERQQQLEARDRELREAAAALAREQKRLASGEKRLQQATRELTAQRRKLEQAEALLQQRTAELDARARQLEQTAVELDHARSVLDRRSSELDQRDQELALRQRQLDEQAEKLEQARNALRQARQLLGNLDALVEDDPPASTEPHASDPPGDADPADRPPNLLRRLLGGAESERSAPRR